MSDDKHALARDNDERTPLSPATGKSLIRDLAAAHGVDEKKFWNAIQVAAGCKNAQPEHFLVLLLQSQKYGLDPLSSPPQLQLLDVGQGPQVYARLDAFKSFLHRAEAAGRVEWRRYVEGWFPDPRLPPEKKGDRRGGKVTMKLRGHPEPIEKIVWFDEWSGKGQWSSRGSHMLEARAWKEACRDWLGFFLYDADDAERIRDEPRAAQVEVGPTRPLESAIPIRTISRGVPALEGTGVQATQVDLDISESPGGGSRAIGGSPPANTVQLRASPVDTIDEPLPDPESEEGKRLSRELDLDLFDERDKTVAP